MPQQVVNLKIRGLNTNDQYLGEAQPGSFLECKNFNHDRDGVLEKRRGFFLYGDTLGSSVDRVKQLFTYKGRVIRHYLSTLDYDNGSGTFTSWSGSYDEPAPDEQRMKAQEMSGNFYFTSDNGIKKISASSASDFSSVNIVDAGGVKALDVTLKANYATPGFFIPLSKVAYRIVWAYRDKNNNVVRGTPSSFTTVINASETDTSVVDLTFPIPDDITTEHFYEIYRSALVTSLTLDGLEDLIPEDELFLVVEDFPATLTGSVTVTDITPDDFRLGGSLLYTNPISGEGILQANEPPPLAKDIALYKNYSFYANTKSRHRLDLNLISTNGFVSGDTKLIISSTQQTDQYTFVGETSESNIEWTTANYAAITDLDAKYFFLKSASGTRDYFLWFDATGTTAKPINLDVAGKIEIPVDVSAAVTNEDVVDAMKAILDLTLDFVATKSGAGGTDSIITITNCCNGDTDPYHISNATLDPIPTPAGGAITFNDQTTTGDGEDTSLGEIILSTKLTPGQRIEEMSRSIVKVINAASGGIVSAQYLSGPDDVPGQMIFEARDVEDVDFYIGIEETTPGANASFNPEVPNVFDITSYTQANPAEITTGSAHGFTTGFNAIIFGTTGDTPNVDGTHDVIVTSPTTFTIPIDTTIGTVGTGGRVFLTSIVSDNEAAPNRIYYSKQQQPEAVPLVNFIDIGPKDKSIKRIIALRDSLYILKEDGVYRLSGEVPATFTVSIWDSSAIINAPDTAAVLNNIIYCLTTAGVASIKDTGVEIESKNIENYINSSIRNNNYGKYSFGLASETDRAYYMWITEKSSDASATQCLRFNTDTTSWTVWDVAKTAGVINSSDDKIYLGASDTNQIEKERKDLERTDHADREFTVQLLAQGISGNTITQLSTFTNVEIGDVIHQVQYLTLAQYNRTLRKLDLDPGLTDTDYESLLVMVNGDNITSKMFELKDKLNLDDTDSFVDTNGNAAYVFTGPSLHVDIQTEFNEIVDRLNESPTTIYNNYFKSEGIVNYEAIIIDKDKDFKVLTVFEMPSFIIADMTVYKAFESKVTWTPNHAGDPSALKRITDATVLFEDLSFTTGRVTYQTDLIKSFEGPEFVGEGTGIFGQVDFGEEGFGGVAASRPQRVIIPRDKSRCRYVSPRYQHENARENIKIYGISLTIEMTSQRGYRS